MRVIIPLPDQDFDPSEAAIPWQHLKAKGVQVLFATPAGKKAVADPRMVYGNGLGVFRSQLMARADAVQAYKAMEKEEAFLFPMIWDAVNVHDFDGLLLPGGHAKGVREYLESPVLQKLVVSFFHADKPVAAVCHGVLLAARSIDPLTGKSVLYEKQTTCLLHKQERLAYHLTRLWLGDYYLTYPGTTTEKEVISFLKDKTQFHSGPFPFARDKEADTKHSFIVCDGNYLSARWPGDIYRFAQKFYELVKARATFTS